MATRTAAMDDAGSIGLVKRWRWGIAGPTGWGIGDQALSSLTNFLLGLFVARAAGPRDLGAFSLAFATYAMMLNVSQALGSEPLVVRHAAFADRKDWDRQTSMAVGIAVAVGLAAGAGSLVLALIGRGALAEAFLALSLTFPGLLLQDAWRAVFFAGRRPRAAFANDLVWAIVLCLGLLAIETTGHATIFWVTFAWGGAATVAAIIGAFQARLLPRPLKARAWLVAHRDLAPRYLGELTIGAGAEPLAFWGIGAVAGLIAVGAIRGAQMLLGPLYVSIIGFRLALVPEAVRLAKVSVRRLSELILMFALVICVATLAWGTLVFLIPERVGIALLKSSWLPARAVLVPVTVTMAAFGLMTAAVVGLRALAAAKLSLQVKLISTPIIIGSGIAGAMFGGMMGAAWGLALANCVGAALFWGQYRRAVSRHRANETSIAQLDHGGTIPDPIAAEDVLADPPRAT
jgi:O-antigen/teichoic acid export membrane protein